MSIGRFCNATRQVSACRKPSWFLGGISAAAMEDEVYWPKGPGPLAAVGRAFVCCMSFSVDLSVRM